MLLSLHRAFADNRIPDHAIDFILPIITKNLSNEFCRFIDGGSYIGWRALKYSQILKSNLTSDAIADAVITCYEPLPQNFFALSKRLADINICRLKNVAISSTNDIANFVIPSRLTDKNSSPHVVGISYNGFLSSNDNFETIKVEQIRIDTDLNSSPDFVKLDLQGGEFEAIKGMGHLLSDTKILYVETQLMRDDNACQYLTENGFDIYFDKFQFGLNANETEVPILELNKLGIHIDKTRYVNGTGSPLILWGYFEGNPELFKQYSFTPEVRNQLRNIGVQYFQTDAICINTKYSNKIYPHLSSIINN